MAWTPWAGVPLRVHSHVSMGTVSGIIFLSEMLLFIWLFFHPSELEENAIIMRVLKFNSYLLISSLLEELWVSRVLCRFAWLQSSLGLIMSWPIENGIPCNCSVQNWRGRCGPRNSSFPQFFLDLFSVLSLLQCVYVYVCISVSPSLMFPSLWTSLWVQISVYCFSFLLIFHFWLFLASQAS